MNEQIQAYNINGKKAGETNEVYFVSLNLPKKHKLNYVNLRMFIFDKNDTNKLVCLTKKQINELQKDFRKHYSALSNVFILNHNTRGYYDCVYYPVIILLF